MPSASPSSARRTRAAWTICFRSGASAPASAACRSSARPTRPGPATRRAGERSSSAGRRALKTKTPCARRTLATLATRAYRRPVPEQRSVDRHPDGLLHVRARASRLRHRHSVRARARPRRSAIHLPLRARALDARGKPLPDGAVYRLDNFELASRLSFFLWSSVPDDELLAAAKAGTLTNPAVLERQTRRMLADPKADALVDNVAGQWLLLRQLDAISPGTKEFDGNLRYAFRRETELLFETHPARRSQRARPARRRLHVRGRAARAALRHSQRQRQPLPARDAAATARGAACSARAAS